MRAQYPSLRQGWRIKSAVHFFAAEMEVSQRCALTQNSCKPPWSRLSVASSKLFFFGKRKQKKISVKTKKQPLFFLLG
jgi:hypothetical protein